MITAGEGLPKKESYAKDRREGSMTCKACGSLPYLSHYLENAWIRGVQRCQCKRCGLNHVLDDRRTVPNRTARHTLAVILYALGKASFGSLGKPEVPSEVRELEFHEMWHFVGSKKTSDGSSRHWTVALGDVSTGLWAIMILTPSNCFTPKSST